MADATPTVEAEEVGRRLRGARRLRGWSLAEAAAASGGRFKATTLAAYERGERRVTVDTLCALARLYEAPLASLIPASASADGHDAELAARISHLPRPHRRLVASLVDRMVEDTRSLPPPHTR